MENEKIVRLEETLKSTNKRLDNLELKFENMYELIISVKEIALEMKVMREDVNKIDTRVKTIEEKPVKRYETVVGQVVSIIVAGIVGFFLAKFGI